MKDETTGEVRVVDFGFVGDVQDVDASLLSLLMENGYVPVLASLGADENGTILNINADTVSSVLAADLKASKLISLTAVAGVLRDKEDPASLIPMLTVKEARGLAAAGKVSGGMKPKIAALCDAVEKGVRRGHILSGLQAGSILLELFTRDGCGTLIAGDAEAAEAAADAAAARKAEESAAQSERLPGATPAVGRPSWDAPAGAGPR
jgi:acetylglutamate kinase